MENNEKIEKWNEYNIFIYFSFYMFDNNDKKSASMKESIVCLKEKTKRLEL